MAATQTSLIPYILTPEMCTEAATNGDLELLKQLRLKV